MDGVETWSPHRHQVWIYVFLMTVEADGEIKML